MSRKSYPPRVARAALGIRAQDLRTLVRKAWWARRWIASLEALRLGARLGRGRQYAVSGQVTDILLAGPKVTASVMGSRPCPYKVELDFTTPPEAALDRLAARIAARPVLIAQMLTNDLPIEVEALFADEGCSLFPVAGSVPPYDVKMTCSCPDWSKPCKHVAAVMFLLGEEVAHHPLTLLSLRGLDVDDIIPKDQGGGTGPLTSLGPVKSLSPLEPLGVLPDGDSLAVLRRLGPIPFWRGLNPCMDVLERIVLALGVDVGDVCNLRR